MMTSRRRGDEPTRRADGEGLQVLLARYMVCPRASRPASFLHFVRENNPHVFSHHDHTQADYRDHVWTCAGLHVCRGCTVVFVSTVTAFVIALVTAWPLSIPTTAIGLTFIALLLLAHVPLPKSPRTIAHDLRRAVLGVLLGSAAAYVILCDDWMLRAMVVGVYLAVLVIRRTVTRRTG